MFKDQLLLSICLQHHRVLVEGTDTACQLHSAQQVDCYVQPLFAGRVEEGILNVLRRLAAFHSRSPLILDLRHTNCKTTARSSRFRMRNTGGQPASSQPEFPSRAAWQIAASTIRPPRSVYNPELAEIDFVAIVREGALILLPPL